MDTAEEPEDQTSNSSCLAEDDSNYPDLTGIDLLIETAPSDAIRLQLIEERNALMFGDSVDNYLKEIQEWYLQITTVDTSWYQYRMMSTPDSMLPPFLRSQLKIDWLEGAQAYQKSVREREERIAELQRQIQWEESIYPSQDVLGYFGPPESRISPARQELNRLLYGDQQALESIQRGMYGGWSQPRYTGPTLEAAPNFARDDLMSDYNFFFYYGNPKQVVTELVRRPPGYTPPNTVGAPVSFKSDEFVSTSSTWHPVDQIDYSRGDDSKMIEWIKDFLENTAEERPDLEGYLERAEEWMERRNIPIPMKTPSNTGDLYNYVPPENEAFNVASSPGFGLPLGGFGAGFLGMPAGGGGKAESSSLSLPSFPSVSLPGLGGGPSALPSPVGLGGVVGGVPTTPSVDLANIGWDGAAMPTPSLGFTGIGGGSAPTSPSRGGFGGGVTGGGGFNLGAGLGAGASATPSFAVSARIPSTDRFIPAPIGGPQADYPNIGLGTTPLNQMNAPQQSQQPQMQPQQVVRMIVNRHETISKKKLEQYVTAWLESQSRVG